MEYYIGNTDYEWYKFLRKENPEDINFWQPGGLSKFKAIPHGSPFLLKLKYPINKVAGVGFFSSHSILPIHFVWEVFGTRNGTKDYNDFYNKIKSYRGIDNKLEDNPNIGCIILTNPIFFNEKEWISIPENWKKNIVQGKTYNTSDESGKKYWMNVEALIQRHSASLVNNQVQENIPEYGHYLTKVRIGQGAFRVLITDAYLRRCAITGEKTLPVLEAAHIKPYSTFGINSIDNGVLLRSDLHKLLDNGYMTITKEYKVEVSKRIKEEYENGRDYYKLHGNSLISLPNVINEMPNKNYLEWHNSNVFR